MEALCLHHEVVLVAHLLLNLLDILTWESRNDAVYKRGTHVTVVGKPCLESLIIRSKVFLPQFDVLVNALFEVMEIGRASCRERVYVLV
jgi:hypothetical protein